MATRLLPAVKRYALGTEPVREAAKVTVLIHHSRCLKHFKKTCVISFGRRFTSRLRKCIYRRSKMTHL